MEEITLEMIVRMHDGVLERDDGDRRIVSEGNLHQIVFLANQKEDPVSRAATLFWSLCAFPVFREGNRRTACRLARQILAAEGCGGDISHEEMQALMQGIDAFTTEADDVERVLRHYVKRPTER